MTRLFLILLLAAGCGIADETNEGPDGAADAHKGLGEICHARAGGAFVTFGSSQDDATILLWIENEQFIGEAVEKMANPDNRLPLFEQVLVGQDCDSRYHFHVDPNAVQWAEVTTEVCDAAPGYIEDNVDEWTQNPGNWCPWGLDRVLKVERK